MVNWFIDLETKGILFEGRRAKKLELNSYQLSKELPIFKSLYQIHSLTDLTTKSISYYFWNIKLLFNILGSKFYTGLGWSRSYHALYVEFFNLMGRCIRFAGCKPIRTYKSRNNGLNAQIPLPHNWHLLITGLGFSRRTLKERSEKSMKKKLSNLRKKNQNKLKEKKKGPVVRSRDKKKSVWDWGYRLMLGPLSSKQME
jgi:hypothetical protein